MEKDFQTEVLTRLTAIETKLDDYKNYKDKCETAYSKSQSNEQDIEKINDKISWITRLVVGAVVMAVLGIVIVCVK